MLCPRHTHNNKYSIGRKKSFWNLYAKVFEMCVLSGAICSHFYSSVVHLELSALSSWLFFYGELRYRKLILHYYYYYYYYY